MLSLLLLAASPFQDPDVHYHEQVAYYPIKADNWDALLEVVRHRPGKGNKAWAQTAWNASYKVAFASDQRRCWISAMEVTLKVTISLPRWLDTPRELKPRWEAFYEHIHRHEYRHRQHVIDMIKALRSRAMALPPGPDCGAIKASYLRIKSELEQKREQQDNNLDEQDRLWQISEQQQATS